jgi:hypothetical protein
MPAAFTALHGHTLTHKLGNDAVEYTAFVMQRLAGGSRALLACSSAQFLTNSNKHSVTVLARSTYFNYGSTKGHQSYVTDM